MDSLADGTYFLKEITASFERIYERKSAQTAYSERSPDPLTTTTDDEESDDFVSLDIEASTPSVGGRGKSIDSMTSLTKNFASKASFGSFKGGMTRNSTYVWASGRPNVNVVVTGVAAALPGRHTSAFKPGVDSIQRIIAGENFITAVPDYVKVGVFLKLRDGRCY